MKPVVLALAAWYLPGYKAGGLVRSLASLVEWLGDEIDFRLVARNHDFRDEAPYPHATTGRWQRVGNADVLYVAERDLGWRFMRQLLRTTRHDVLYLNSLLSPAFTITPLVLRRLRLVPRRPVVLAPRGELAPGALALKPAKKLPYLLAARVAGLYQDVTWQAATPAEEADVRRWFGPHARVAVAPDLPPRSSDSADEPAPDLPPKQPGRVRAVFLSRIARVKNLDGALEILRQVRADTALDVYGHVQDAAYWAECQELLRALPANVRVAYGGEVSPAQVLPTLRGYDLFFLPTYGESYGHVILEAMRVGCPALISDRTPWRNLEHERAGWDLPLDAPLAFARAIDRVAAMDGETHRAWSRGARAYAERHAGAGAAVEAVALNRRLFLDEAAGRTGYARPTAFPADAPGTGN